MKTFKIALTTTLLLFTTALQAHRFHAGIVDIGYNEKTGGTEIVHTYMAHDVEALLSELYQRQFDLSQPEDEAILRKYVEKQFFILAADKSRLPIHWVGLSVNVDSVVIYQEIEQTPLTQAARIHNEVLTDFIPDQANTLKLTRAGTVRSFLFDRKTIELGLR